MILSYKEDKFIRAKESLIRQGADFRYEASGGSEKIIWDKNDITYSCFKKPSEGKGFHVCKMAHADIDKWLSVNTITPRGQDYKEQLFNLPAIERSIGDYGILALDLENCYWKTAERLGYITPLTFIRGLRKPEWKDGRNAAIGGLAKVKYVTTYINGYPSKPKPELPPIEYQYIRHHVIGAVYDMFLELRGLLGDGFLMFLTDCIYTGVENRPVVDRFFEERGYFVQAKPVEFLSVDRENRKVYWFDYHKRDRRRYETSKPPYVSSFYSYTGSQLLSPDC